MQEAETDISIDGKPSDPKPMQPHEDQLAYMIVAAGIAASVKSGNVYGLLIAVGVYAIGYFGLRINYQNKLKGK